MMSRSECVNCRHYAKIQHILGKINLENPYEILSADVDMNEKININDITWLRRLILGITTRAPGQKVLPFYG
ncbi:MAG: hypothetical protein U0T81_09580 [Saprospiraceae bacterium]